ncbi:hypothetical protein [Gimesia fumaroli]|jgi:hypothetical protein|uniref:Uncharacterized protein n=1 Tax=Gimesia fumaroli TaxID=2527976 RepID=A0A518IET4_9PLAN|nr:hypothetical protein [Gimesia fumaroli]QDV51577.1 hypothetical protein Enr17x_36330 [Gimesia fumaroli]
MNRFVWCLITALLVPAMYGCSSEMSEEERKESIQTMEEEGKKMEELLPAKLN